MEIVQIVPRLFPTNDGIGDHAAAVAETLKERFNIATKFMVADPGWRGEMLFPGSVALRGPEAVAETLKQLGGDAIVLHYVGYGYSPKGCPRYLVEGLRGCGKRLVIFFHELASSGPIWSSAFWSRPIQYRIITELAGLADLCITNLESTATYLRGVARGEVIALPVISTVGEAGRFIPWEQKEPKVVVFGTPGRRFEVYRRSADIFAVLSERFGELEVIDVGAPVKNVPTGVRALGELDREDIADLLNLSRFGVVDYPASLLGKSSIFAAFGAFSVVPVVVGERAYQAPTWGLKAGETYLTKETVANGEVNRIADNVYRWYIAHSLDVWCERYVRALKT